MNKWDSGILGFCIGSFIGNSESGDLREEKDFYKQQCKDLVAEINALRLEVHSLNKQLDYLKLQLQYPVTAIS